MEQEAEQPVPVQGGSSDGLESDRVSRVRKLLFRQMLVGIKDGRFFLGNFYCMDKQGNIIFRILWSIVALDARLLLQWNRGALVLFLFLLLAARHAIWIAL